MKSEFYARGWVIQNKSAKNGGENMAGVMSPKLRTTDTDANTNRSNYDGALENGLQSSVEETDPEISHKTDRVP